MAGVRGGAAVDVDDADLAVVALVVVLEQPLQRDRRGRPVVEVGQGQALVGDVGVGLGGDRADPGHRGGYGGPDREELRGDGHPPRLSVGGPGHDRERHGPHDSEPGPTAAADTRLPSTAVEVGQSTGAPSARLPVRRPPPAVRHRDRDRRGRQRRVHADLDALLPRRHRPDAWSRSGPRSRWPRLVALPTGPLIGSVVDRIGAKQVLLAGNAAPGRRLRRLPVLRLVRRGDALDGRGHRRPHRVLGLLRQHRRGDLGAGGAGEVVRLPRRAPQRRLRARRPASPAWRSRSAPQTAYAAVVVANAVSYAVAFVLLLAVPATERGRARARSPARGRRCCATGPTGCCGSPSWRSRSSMMVLNFALPVYAITVLGLPGWVTGAVFTINTIMVGFGQGLVGAGDDRPGPLADPGARPTRSSRRRTSSCSAPPAVGIAAGRGRGAGRRRSSTRSAS